MTKEKQRIAIAKLHGWNNIHQLENRDVFMGWWSGEPKASLVIPDYLNSRDEVAKVLEKLKNSKEYPNFKDTYAYYLKATVYADIFINEEGFSGSRDYDIYTSTAEQQVKAILRSTNLWEHE